jgi:FKBP-type peptidyl-prolyl cis-trans isomerase SlyD
MKIANGTVVEIDYTLHLGDGEVVDRSEGEPLAYIHGEGHIVPGLEQALAGLDVGEKKQVVVAPGDGYGEHDPRGVQEVSRQAFPDDFDPKVGMQLVAEAPSGEPVQFVVKEVRQETVLVDFNHPLAGRTLHFDVTVREVRPATEEEIAHGHAHGPGGHGHGHEEE